MLVLLNSRQYIIKSDISLSQGSIKSMELLVKIKISYFYLIHNKLVY